MRLAFKLVDWVKPITLLIWVGLFQSVEGLNRTKSLTLLQIRAGLQTWTLAFTCFFGLELKYLLFLGHELAAFRRGLYHRLSWVSGIWSWLIARIGYDGSPQEYLVSLRAGDTGMAEGDLDLDWDWGLKLYSANCYLDKRGSCYTSCLKWVFAFLSVKWE